MPNTITDWIEFVIGFVIGFVPGFIFYCYLYTLWWRRNHPKLGDDSDVGIRRGSKNNVNRT